MLAYLPLGSRDYNTKK